MTDDDPSITPEQRQHFREFHPGTPVVRAVEAEFARLRHTVEAQGRAIDSLVASRRTQHKLVWLLAGSLATVLVFAANRIAASSEQAGKAQATSEAHEKRVQRLEGEIDQLRAALLKFGLVDAKPITIVRNP